MVVMFASVVFNIICMDILGVQNSAKKALSATQWWLTAAPVGYSDYPVGWNNGDRHSDGITPHKRRAQDGTRPSRQARIGETREAHDGETSVVIQMGDKAVDRYAY